MGAARAENGAIWMYPWSHPEDHLDTGTGPPEGKGGQQQASICAQSERGNRHLSSTER